MKVKKIGSLSVAVLLSGCLSGRYQGPPSDHFDGRRFFSPYGPEPGSLWEVLKWKIRGSGTPWPDRVENEARPAPAAAVSDGEAVLTFVNHATMLVQLNGLNILTDPVYSERTSPVTWAGPRRVRDPGLSFERLPRIDLVLISHNHYDHLDMATVARLAERDQPLFLVALGDGRLIEGLPDVKFREMDWGQTETVGRTKITYLPAQHWSARGPFDRNLSLWGSFLVEGPGFNFYFAGDTGYSRHFAEIAANHPRIDLALLPIGAYEPRWFMQGQHLNPADAVQAHRDLKAGLSVGIHFGTWKLTDEGIGDPLQALAEARGKAGVGENEFLVLKEGETRSFRARQ